MHQFRKLSVNPILLVMLGMAVALSGSSLVLQAEAPAAKPPSGPAPAVPTVVVTLDLEKVLNSLDAKNVAKAKVDEKAKELEAQRLAKVKEAKELELKLDLLPKGTAKYDETEKAFQHAAYEAQALVDFTRQKLAEVEGDGIRKLYKDAKAGLDEYATANGYDLVLLNDCVRDIDSGTGQEVMQQISARRILFFKDAIDVTDDFIGWMNAKPKLAAGG